MALGGGEKLGAVLWGEGGKKWVIGNVHEEISKQGKGFFLILQAANNEE